MTTIADIAARAKVSKSTVSKVLNNYKGVSHETRERVHRIVTECGYFPNTTARSLITNRSKLIGLFLASQLNDPFFREVIDGIEKTLGPLGYDILYLYTPAHCCDGQPIGYVEKVKTRTVDGVIFLGFVKDELSQFDRILESDIPSVFLDLDLVGPYASYVMSDNLESGFMAADYLIKLGHSKIGLLDGTHVSKPAQDRFAGFGLALADRKVAYNPNWVFRGEFSAEAGYQGMQSLLDLPDVPTAIVAQDSMAVGAMEALRQRGKRVPEDMSIVGFDDMEFSRYCGLTTVRQHKDRMGEAASKLLLKIIRQESFAPVTIGTTFVERGSCQARVDVKKTGS
ncbi:MAG: LacI family transcriptional regulator [Firmicutes bacterium]|nr:LacI family transcriptional regulator [Bacillota bacterium]